MNSARQQLRSVDGIMRVIPEMTEEQFVRWSRLLALRTGMQITRDRKSFMTTAIGLRMQELGIECFDEYYDRLMNAADKLIEWSTLVDRITIHETRFFRHPHSMNVIRDYVFSKQANEKTGAVDIQAWSVGCATGEEAYTLAMTIDRALLQRGDDSFFGVTATDISQPAIQHGREAVYSKFRIGKCVEPDLLEDYFEEQDREHYKVREHLARRVCFARMNLQDVRPGSVGKMDIIYCQNVLIYFDREARLKIAEMLMHHLVPGGLLILGSGELLNFEHPEAEKLRDENTLAYRKTGR